MAINKDVSIDLTQYCKIIELEPDIKYNIFHANQNTINSNTINVKSIPLKNTTNYGIFLLHGVGGCTAIWQNQIPMLIDLELDVISVDFLGHGLSSTPKDPKAYSFQKMAKDVLAIYDKFKRASNFIMSHSYGCCFASLIAHERASSVIGLIMLSGGAPAPIGSQFGIISLPLCFLTCVQNLLWKIFIKKSFYKNNSSQVMTRTSTFVIQSTMLGQNWEEGDTKYYASLTVPTLILHGLQDKLVDLEEADFMYRTLRNSELYIVEQSGHMIMLEQPETTNELTRNFITLCLNSNVS